jgi:hypothetical protein
MLWGFDAAAVLARLGEREWLGRCGCVWVVAPVLAAMAAVVAVAPWGSFTGCVGERGPVWANFEVAMWVG